MRSAWWRVSVTVLAAAALAGCNPGYQHEGFRSPAAAVSPRTAWRVTGSLSQTQNAIDGNPGTAALGAAPDNGGAITIDLGKPCMLNMVVIDHGPNEMGFARRVLVSTSMDGRSFRQCYVGPGKRRVTVLSLVAPEVARYVRIQAAIPGLEPWSVAEVYFQ